MLQTLLMPLLLGTYCIHDIHVLLNLSMDVVQFVLDVKLIDMLIHFNVEERIVFVELHCRLQNDQLLQAIGIHIEEVATMAGTVARHAQRCFEPWLGMESKQPIQNSFALEWECDSEVDQSLLICGQ